MQLKRVDPLSAGKVLGILYAGMGLLVGALFSLLAIVGVAAGGQSGGIEGMVLGVGAIIVFPLFYGVMGAVVAVIGAVLYNLIARTVGGLELDIS